MEMEIGKLKVSVALQYLKPIAQAYGLKLNRPEDFKLVRKIFVNLYCHELITDGCLIDE